MEKNDKGLVDYYHHKKIDGMDFSQIRKELSEKGIEESKIKEIVREIDNRILNGDTSKPLKLKAKELRLIGWTLMIIGGVLTIGIRFNWFDFGEYHFISILPVVAGYLCIVVARRAQRKN